MNKTVATGLLVVLLYTGIAAAQEQKGARIEVKELRHNFGKVEQGTQVSHVFEIRSVGTETLVIERVQPG